MTELDSIAMNVLYFWCALCQQESVLVRIDSVNRIKKDSRDVLYSITQSDNCLLQFLICDDDCVQILHFKEAAAQEGAESPSCHFRTFTVPRMTRTASLLTFSMARQKKRFLAMQIKSSIILQHSLSILSSQAKTSGTSRVFPG